MISILRPSTSPPKSSAAIFAAVSLPAPVMSAYSPDMSRMPPSFSGGFDCAIAVEAVNPITVASNAAEIFFIAYLPSYRVVLARRLLLRRSCRNAPAAASRGNFRKAESCHGSSWPGLTRPSIPFERLFRRLMDARVKPGHDDYEDGGRSGQQALARNMVELEPDAVGVLEQQRVISRRPAVLARRANDPGIHRGEKGMKLVDIAALAGAKTQMMQADPVLLERGARMPGSRRANSHRGSSADAIVDLVAIDHRLQPEKRQ